MEKLSRRFKRILSQPASLRQWYKNPVELLERMTEYFEKFEEKEIIVASQEVVDGERGYSTQKTVPGVLSLLGFCAFHCISMTEIKGYVFSLSEQEDRTPEEEDILSYFAVFETVCQESLLLGGISGRYNASIASLLLDLKNNGLNKISANGGVKLVLRNSQDINNLKQIAETL